MADLITKPKNLGNTCPEGTKFWLLETGWLECDEGFLIRAGNSSGKSSEHKSFVNKRRELPSFCVLIEHPAEGLILWDTGCGRDYPQVWGPTISDAFARVRYESKHELRSAIETTGHTLDQITHVIISHLHVDHAGGLDEFATLKHVGIWVHEQELKSAFWCVATGCDEGVYLEHCLKPSLNWKTFNESTFEFCQGITLHHLPGHTEGLLGIQINLATMGTFIFMSDHCHVSENWIDRVPSGWLARDHVAWFRSTEKLKHIQKLTGARVIPGHDKGIFLALQGQADVFT